MQEMLNEISVIFRKFSFIFLCFSNKNAEIRNEILWKNSTMVSEFFR